MTTEPAGQRTRKRYHISDAGRTALRTWLAERYLRDEGEFQERAHLDSLAGDLLTATLTTLADGFERLAGDVKAWDNTLDRDPVNRECLARIVERARNGQ